MKGTSNMLTAQTYWPLHVDVYWMADPACTLRMKARLQKPTNFAELFEEAAKMKHEQQVEPPEEDESGGATRNQQKRKKKKDYV